MLLWLSLIDSPSMHTFVFSHPFSTSTVVATFMNIVQKLHGNPKIIVSDRDLIFTGKFWTKLFSCLGTQLAHSSSYHLRWENKVSEQMFGGISALLCIV